MLVSDELEVLDGAVDLADHPRVVEIGCGAAELTRRLLDRYPAATVEACDVDEVQHAANLSAGGARVRFHLAGARSLPFADGSFDLALMLKSLHHVPEPDMGPGLREAARVLRPGGYLYVSEPVYAGPLNDVMRLFHDEGEVRRLAAEAVGRAVAEGTFRQVKEVDFDLPVHYDDEADFERRSMHATFHDDRAEGEVLDEVRRRLAAHRSEHGGDHGGEHGGDAGIDFVRPMRVYLLQKPSGSGGPAEPTGVT